MAYNFRRTLAGAMLAEIVDENDALKRIKSASIWFYINAIIIGTGNDGWINGCINTP